MVMQYRRDEVNDATIQKSTNASLWLNKYYKESNDPQQEAKQVFVQDIVEKIEVDPSYTQYFQEWEKALESFGAKTKNAHTLGRLSVNLGAESVLETNVALHHTYGVPFIPGSALKGLAAHFADQNLDDHWKMGTPAHEIVFGTTDQAGYLTFFDALYVPNSGQQGHALWKDVITVHHADYYQTGDSPPADWDGTTIIPFIVANGSFLVGLAGPDDWVEKTFEILALALEKEGVGAKTSSGYGRMTFKEQTGSSTRPSAQNYELEKRRLLEEKPPAGTIRGVVKVIKKNGEYGFIIPQGGGGDHFIHSSNLLVKGLLKEGQILQYKVVQTPKGPQGREVEILLEP